MAQSMTSHRPVCLTAPEQRFLRAYAESGDQQEALKAAGLWDADKDKRYRRCRKIFRKAQDTGAWQDTLARHGLTYDELAQRLRELVYSADSRTAVQALKLVMQSSDLLREKPESQGGQGRRSTSTSLPHRHSRNPTSPHLRM